MNKTLLSCASSYATHPTRSLCKIALAGAVAATFGLSSAHAGVISLTNGGFELGDLSGWSTIGAVIASPSTTVTTFNNVVWAVNAAQTHLAQMTSSGSGIAAIETALGLTAGTLNALNTNPNGGSLTDGSALYQSFSGMAGDTVSFWWNYVATDYIPFNDPAFAMLLGTASQQIKVLASIHGQGVAVGTAGNSGWLSHSFTLPTDGTYTLAFVTTNDKDQSVDSVLHIDNLAGACEPNCPPIGVPEPGALALLGIGLMGLAAARRRKSA